MRLLLVAMLMTAFSPVSAHARVSFDAAVSQDYPAEEFGEVYEPVCAFGGDVFFSLPSQPRLGIGGRFSWNRFVIDESLWNDGGITIIEMAPSVRYTFTPPESRFSVFGQAGAGLYVRSAVLETKTRDFHFRSNSWGFSVGAGAAVGFSEKVRFMVMPLIHRIRTEGESTTWLSLDVGLLFR